MVNRIDTNVALTLRIVSQPARVCERYRLGRAKTHLSRAAIQHKAIKPRRPAGTHLQIEAAAVRI
jgi:hypothetical protein